LAAPGLQSRASGFDSWLPRWLEDPGGPVGSPGASYGRERELRIKLLAALGVLAICAVGLTGIAGAREPAKTKVTIHYNGDGFQGKVKSSRAKCIKNRTVKVFRKNGTKLYTDTSDRDGFWNTGNSGQVSGTFYAHTRKTPGCKGGTSDLLHVTP
jgi:hypothetical protein